MLSLRETQEQFLRAVLHAEVNGCEWIKGDAISASNRLAIYANNARLNFLDTLAATYPVVQALAGGDWFRQTALAYRDRHPSRAGNLHFIGESFAVFLREQLTSTPYAYFADVAALEWAYQEALVAADHPHFDVAALGSVPSERYGELHFELHPAVRLVSSPYPILDLWRAHQPGAAGLDQLDLTAGAQYVVLARLEDHVEFRAIDAGSWQLLRSLAEDATLGTAAEAALVVDPQFDLTTALAQCIARGVLVDFSLPFEHQVQPCA